jgi:cell wall-associated NlpC family hydrolase
MSMVHKPAGVAGGFSAPALEAGSESTTSVLQSSSSSQPIPMHIWRSVAAFACVIALFAATAASSLAAPESGEDAGGYTYAEMGYDDPNEAAEALAQDTAASGQFIADYAMQFLGYPYVSAGNTPGGFDCSGFTQYVILNTLGYDIGHGVAGQTGSGYWVNWGEWQPGDLVYFAGTYRAGISHTGVYIGDGQFIHAENPGTGVVISSLYSDYYAGHYYGAYRHV